MNDNIEITINAQENIVEVEVSGGIPGPRGPAGDSGTGGGSGYTEADTFSPVLTLTENTILPPTTISGPTTFSVTGTPLPYQLTFVRLTADGVNVPTFPGISKISTSEDWDNTAGVVNIVGFFWDTVEYFYTILRSAGATPLPLAPGIPTLSLGTLAATSIGLTWTLPGGGTPDDYIVEYRQPAGTWSTFADGTSTTRAATVTGLTPETAYEFRVSATNAVGTSGVSNVITGTTAAVATDSYVRLNQLNGSLVESGNGTTGWLYNSTSGSAWASYGQSTVDALLGDGNIRTAAKADLMIGFSKNSTLVAMGNDTYAPFFDGASGTLYMVRMADGIMLQCNVVSGLSISGSNITEVRVSVTGAVLKTEVLIGATWTLVDQYTDPSGVGTHYPWVTTGKNITTDPIIAIGAS